MTGHVSDSGSLLYLQGEPGFLGPQGEPGLPGLPGLKVMTGQASGGVAAAAGGLGLFWNLLLEQT